METVSVRYIWRELQRSAVHEVYRRFRIHGEVCPSLDGFGIGAPPALKAPHCSWVDVPVGTLFIERYRTTQTGRAPGRYKTRFGLVTATEQPDDQSGITYLTHRALRSRPVYLVELPDGTTLDVPRSKK